jgi:hypothetical protein
MKIKWYGKIKGKAKMKLTSEEKSLITFRAEKRWSSNNLIYISIKVRNTAVLFFLTSESGKLKEKM